MLPSLVADHEDKHRPLPHGTGFTVREQSCLDLSRCMFLTYLLPPFSWETQEAAQAEQ